MRQLKNGLAALAALVAGAAIVADSACSPQPQAGEEGRTRAAATVIAPAPKTPPSSPAASPSDTGPDARPLLTRLEREARALAKTQGCGDVAACRTAPVGWRGCGGPRTYLVYCAATTDTVALFRKLKELQTAERDYNASSGMMSTCEFRLPPRAILKGGNCREAPAGP